MKRFLLFLSLLSCSLLCISAVYTPKSVPDPKRQGQDYYVSNPDKIISAEMVDSLNDVCIQLYDSTYVEMAVVAVSNIGDLTPFEFGYKLFELWGIGGKERNTGVLITFVLDSHDIYINTGTGIEGVLPDATCRMVIDRCMIPEFKSGNYSEGLLAGAKAISTICTTGEAPEELQTASFTGSSHYVDDDDEWDGIIGDMLLMLLLLLGASCAILLPFLLLVLLQSKKQTPEKEFEQRDKWLNFLLVSCFLWPFNIPATIWFDHRKNRVRCPNCGKQRLEKTSEDVITPSTTKTRGKKQVKFECTNCGFVHKGIVILPYKSSSSGSYYSGSSSSRSGSSFRGGSSHSSGSWGGGHSSGGGAGAKW